MLTLIAAAFGLGLVFNAAPGPVFAETVRRGVRGGFRPALAVQLGSLAGDALWAVLGLAGVSLLVQLESLRVPIGIAGVVYLLWLARDSWQASTREFAVTLAVDGGHTREALRSGVLLSLTNPQNVAYWAAMGSALGAVGVQEPTVFDYAAFFTGFAVIDRLGIPVCGAGGSPAGWCRRSMGSNHLSRLRGRVCRFGALVVARAVGLGSPSASGSNTKRHFLDKVDTSPKRWDESSAASESTEDCPPANTGGRPVLRGAMRRGCPSASVCQTHRRGRSPRGVEERYGSGRDGGAPRARRQDPGDAFDRASEPHREAECRPANRTVRLKPDTTYDGPVRLKPDTTYESRSRRAISRGRRAGPASPRGHRRS